MRPLSASLSLLLVASCIPTMAQVNAAKPSTRAHVDTQHTEASRGGGPANDICADVVPSALSAGTPIEFNGTNLGATLDDPSLIDADGVEYPAVWEAITTTDCMDITVSYCGSLFEGTVFTTMFTDCDFTGLLRASVVETSTCVDEQFTFTFRRVPAGTYLIPVVADPDGVDGEYTLTVSGTACSDPAVANDECAGGIALAVGSTCTSTTVDVLGATQSIPAAECSGFIGTADEDVWFSFMATTTVAQVRVQGSEGYDAVLEVFSGDCGTLTSLGCLDNSLDGEEEAAQVTELIVGDTYYVRVYDWYVGAPVTTEVSICIIEVPDVAGNDDCPGMLLVMGTECNATQGTVASATQSIPAILCNDFTGVADDDVWHSFVATSTTAVIAAQGGADFDMVLELLGGSCGNTTSLACADATVAGEVERITYDGLTVGTTYYVRLYTYDVGSITEPNYAICVVGVELPANDECAAAEPILVNSAVDCPTASVMGSTAFAAVTSDEPFCDATTEGFQDVWYAFNSLGNTMITVNFENINMEDFAYEVVEGCGGTNVVACEIGTDGPFDVEVVPNTDYVIRVFNNLQFGAGGDFAVCLSGAISTAVQAVPVNAWSVYPNPNDGLFQLVNGGDDMNGVVELFDATGRLVMTDRLVLAAGGIHIFNRTGLASGTYALRISTGKERFDQRVMVR